MLTSLQVKLVEGKKYRWGYDKSRGGADVCGHGHMGRTVVSSWLIRDMAQAMGVRGVPCGRTQVG